MLSDSMYSSPERVREGKPLAPLAACVPPRAADPPARRIERANVLGVGISALDMERAVAEVSAAIDGGGKGYICATSVHGVMEAWKDPSLRRILNRAMMNLPDGRPTVWVARLSGHSAIQQVTGPDFLLRIAAESAARGYTQFFYGGAEGVAELLRDRLVQRFPTLRVVGTYTPPFRALTLGEAGELRELVSRTRPDIFWVGLSTPKQERFIAEYLPLLETKLAVAVGAAFDFHTGRIQESPQWMKKAGIQWLHRLCQEPRRLWRRYLVNNPHFLYQVGLQLLGLRQVPLE